MCNERGLVGILRIGGLSVGCGLMGRCREIGNRQQHHGPLTSTVYVCVIRRTQWSGVAFLYIRALGVLTVMFPDGSSMALLRRLQYETLGLFQSQFLVDRRIFGNGDSISQAG